LNTLEKEIPAITREVFSATSGEFLGPWYVSMHERQRERSLSWLKGFSNYRKRAQAHVVAALQTLNSMSKDMEHLRERAATPELVGGRIPLHAHICSIQNGLQRLRGIRVRAKEREDKVIRRGLGFGAD